jgi:Mrp family chromosome partitioning ATPase
VLENLERSSADRREANATGGTRLALVPGLVEQRKNSGNSADKRGVAATGAWPELRAQLLTDVAMKSLHSLLVTSTEPFRAKTDLTVDVASSAADEGCHVVIVDCNPQPGPFQGIFQYADNRGLSNVLLGHCALDEVIYATSLPGVELVPAGQPSVEQVQFLYSPEMADALQQLCERCDLLLLDTPAYFCATTAVSLASIVDGVLLVRESEQTSEKIAGLISSQLDGIGANLIATVTIRCSESASSEWSCKTLDF